MRSGAAVGGGPTRLVLALPLVLDVSAAASVAIFTLRSATDP